MWTVDGVILTLQRTAQDLQKDRKGPQKDRKNFVNNVISAMQMELLKHTYLRIYEWNCIFAVT